MHFETFHPSDSLTQLVREYWIYENEDTSVSTQKIIPDGFGEIIIHYGDPYRINLNGQWETQQSLLFSSQISKSFFLENTGKSGMLGIKLYPAAFNELFQKDISPFTDQVVPLEGLIGESILPLKAIQEVGITLKNRLANAESWLVSLLTNLKPQTKIKHCLKVIFESHGMTDIDELAMSIDLSVRQLERQFKKVIGLTPKFYCRIIRFNYIFEVMKEHKDSWVRTALQSGYFDQSHFIKNFKEFTGEEPSAYGFDEVNLANFFLQK